MKQIVRITFISVVCIIVLFIAIKFLDISKLAQYASVITSFENRELSECIATFSTEAATTFSIQREDINSDNIPDAVIRHTDETSCGNAGCVHELCISDRSAFTHVPFSYAAHDLSVKETLTNGMHDIVLNNDDEQLYMTWDGISYVLNAN